MGYRPTSAYRSRRTGSGSVYEDCVKDAITNKIFTKLGLTDQATMDLIKNNPDVWGEFLVEDEQTPQVGDGTITNIASLCPNAFTTIVVDPKNPDPNSTLDDDPTNDNSPYNACFLGGFNIQFTFPGNIPITMSISWMKFTMDAGKCPNPSQVISTSMQQALNNVQQLIGNGSLTTQDPDNLRRVFFLQFEAAAAINYRTCANSAGNPTNSTEAAVAVDISKTYPTATSENVTVPRLTISTNPLTGLTSLQDAGCP